MYIKKFDIRWSDLDANRHLANSAFINFMSHTRMSFLTEKGFDQQHLAEYNLGPIVFYEHVYYFREIFAGKPIFVSLELKGLSEDGMFFEFVHKIFDHKGRHCASCEMMGAWMDLSSRKLTALPEELFQKLELSSKSEDFKLLTKEDTRKHGRYPKDLDQDEVQELLFAEK